LDFLKTIFNKFFWLRKINNENFTYIQLEDQLKNTNPCDRFVHFFEYLGGYFSRCLSEEHIKVALRKILRQENLYRAFCCEEELQKILTALKFKYTEDLNDLGMNDVALISCECLIAFDGRILLSYNNIRHFPVSLLPEKIIIVANVSQIEENLNNAMMKVKRRGIFRNITSISGNISELDFPGRKNNKLFLLLVHDYTMK